jgi:tetratricopeptide (TPR) repeat protein
MSSSVQLAPVAVVRSARFDVREQLGSGGAGTVFRAIDRETGEEVALKVLHDASARAARAIRREFEALSAFTHPNVVALRELFDAEEPPFFTMELVPGDDLLAHVRGPDGYDEARLRSAFGQLSRVLRALHRAGRLHRDVKPRNVRVTPEGRLVLLDLGLSVPALVDVPEFAESAGTLPYMAPEQMAGKAGPESDFYALGVVLFQCLTGKLPFTGGAEEILARKQGAEPPRPSVLAAVPEELDALCVRLLSPEPDARPDTAQILTALDRERRAASSASFTLSAVPFLGRQRELATALALCEERTGSAVSVFVRGETGSGKSAFVTALGGQLAVRHESAWLFVDRAEPRPWLPYQGFATLANQLVDRLKELPTSFVAELMPEGAHLICDLFPAFKRLSAFARLDEGARPPDLVERRWLAFGALRTFLARLSQRVPLILAIDDLHWADGDTVRLVTALADRGVPGEPSAITWLLAAQTSLPAGLPRPDLSIALGPLEAADLQLLCGELLDGASSADFLDGNPWLAEPNLPRLAVESIRQTLFFRMQPSDAVPDLSTLYRERILSLDGCARRVTELCAIAGRPITPAVLAASVDFESSEVARAVGLLRSAGILCDALREERCVELACLGLRSVVMSTLDQQSVHDGNLRLLAALRGSEQKPSTALLRFQLGARHLEAARRTAQSLARQAEEALCFEHAAHIYELAAAAWEGQPDEVQREVLEGLAGVLSAAGYTARAAQAYDRASEGAKVAEALELQRKAAEHWLRSGHVEQGMKQLSALLAGVGESFVEGRTQRLLSLVFQRASLSLRRLSFTRRAARQVSPRELTTIDVFWSVGSLVGMVDFVAGADFQTRAVRAALKAGEPRRVAKALALEAGFFAATERAPRPRTTRMIAVAAALAEELADPYLQAMVHLAHAGKLFVEGNHPECVMQGLCAEACFRQKCTQVSWELGLAQQLVVLGLQQGGVLDELVTCSTTYAREALERGDLYGYTNIVTAGGYVVPLVEDRPAGAIAMLDEAMRDWPRTNFHMQHFLELVALAQVDLYRAEGRTLANLERAAPALRQSMLLRVPMIETSHLWHVGLALLESARLDAARRKELIARTQKVVRTLEAMPVAHGPALAAMLHAQLACLAPGKAEPVALATRALALIEDPASGMLRERERAMYLRGLLLGGSAGEALMEEAHSQLRLMGVASPRRHLQQGLPALEVA